MSNIYIPIAKRTRAQRLIVFTRLVQESKRRKRDQVKNTVVNISSADECDEHQNQPHNQNNEPHISPDESHSIKSSEIPVTKNFHESDSTSSVDSSDDSDDSDQDYVAGKEEEEEESHLSLKETVGLEEIGIDKPASADYGSASPIKTGTHTYFDYPSDDPDADNIRNEQEDENVQKSCKDHESPSNPKAGSFQSTEDESSSSSESEGGIVKKAPTILDDLGKDAREMAALQILESLFIQENENEAIVDTDSAQNSKISFDLSERSEDVLQKILKETSEPMTELEKQKWNARPFILHKRASFPKIPLQKLKEALLENSHPVLESLKEMSNLEGADVSENTNTIPEVDVDLNAQTTIAKVDLVSRNTENESNKLQESQLPKSDHAEENSTSGIREHMGRIEHEMSIEPPVKGLEENTLMDHIEHGNLPHVSTSGIQELMGRSEHEISIQPPLKGIEEKTLMDNIEHDNLPHVSTSGPSGKGKTPMKDVSQMEVGTDSDISDDERTDIASKKEAFLSSQCTLSQDFSATIDCTEICLCMKCNKDGALLVCSSDTIRVHESCLASAANFDENGNYFCQFCSYSREISKYLEVKKKVSLARKDLQAFLSSKSKHRPKVSSRKGACLNKDKSREIGAAGENSEVNGNKPTTIRGREDCTTAEPTDDAHVLSSVVSSHLKRPRKHDRNTHLQQFL